MPERKYRQRVVNTEREVPEGFVPLSSWGRNKGGWLSKLAKRGEIESYKIMNHKNPSFGPVFVNKEQVDVRVRSCRILPGEEKKKGLKDVYEEIQKTVEEKSAPYCAIAGKSRVVVQWWDGSQTTHNNCIHNAERGLLILNFSDNTNRHIPLIHIKHFSVYPERVAVSK